MPKTHRSTAAQLAFNYDLEYRRLRQEQAKTQALADIGLSLSLVVHNPQYNNYEYVVKVEDRDLYTQSLERLGRAKEEATS